MLSGELARKFEHEYGASNTAARQALSRAKKPVNKICTLSFDKNQKFFYLESQYMSNRYIERLMDAIKQSSQINWVYICAFQSQNGFVAKSILPSLVSSPIKNVKGHKLHQRVIDDLLKCGIIVVLSDLAKWYFESSQWHRGVNEICAEGARNHGLLNVPTDGFFNTVHTLPSDPEEQLAIASYLSLFQARLDSAQAVLEKLLRIRSGLMQRLFT